MTLEHDHAAHEHDTTTSTSTRPRRPRPRPRRPRGPRPLGPRARRLSDGRRDATAPTRTNTSGSGHGSPIPAAEREAFTGLPYFDVDESLRFEGLTLEPYAGSEPANFQIPTSDGKLREAVRAGTFAFELGGATQRLTGYTFAEGDSRVGLPAVPRRDQRLGDATAPGATSTSYPEDGRHVRARLQPRLPPVVRVRPEVLVPAHARREPAAGPDRGRRAPGCGPRLTALLRCGRAPCARPRGRTMTAPAVD